MPTVNCIALESPKDVPPLSRVSLYNQKGEHLIEGILLSVSSSKEESIYKVEATDLFENILPETGYIELTPLSPEEQLIQIPVRFEYSKHFEQYR
jgi:hypothetical protein